MLAVNSPSFSFSSVCEPVLFSNLLSFLEAMVTISSSTFPHLSLLHLPCSSHCWVSAPSVQSLAVAVVRRGAWTPSPAVGCRKGGRTAEAAAASGLQTCVSCFIFQLSSALQHPPKSIFLLQPLRRGSACCVPPHIPAPD